MNEEKDTDGKVYCKAVIAHKKTIFFYIMCIIAALSVIVSVMIIIPIREEFRYGVHYYYNIIGEVAWSKYRESCWCWLHFEISILISIFVLSILLIITYLLIRYLAKRCTLELNKDGVFRNKKTLFSTRSISLPFEKVDSAYVKNSIIDKCIGGQTIAISSASSCVKFKCVLNAEKFVAQTLTELKKFKSRFLRQVKIQKLK